MKTWIDEVRYIELGLDETLKPEDQFLALDGEPYRNYWQLIKLDSIGFTPRRFAAFGTRWRRPLFPGDDEYVNALTDDEMKRQYR